MNEDFKRYPIGKAQLDSAADDARIEASIAVIGRASKQLTQIAKALTEEQWDQSYREGGWTARQLVHHLADSHMVAFHRQRLAVIAKEPPQVSGYPEKLFALLPDYTADPFLSVILLASLHEKWVSFLNGITDEGWTRGYFHLEENRLVSMKESVQMYAWHSQHHLAHLRLILESK